MILFWFVFGLFAVVPETHITAPALVFQTFVAQVLERTPHFVPVLNGLAEGLSFHVSRYYPVGTSAPH